jgi:recombinational DNA repair protein (RecF pathway)
MSYRTYTTAAVVCGSYERQQADKTYRLFTESFGLLFATARSVREERSRQRYALQDFSFLHVSLVKGKAGWRIGSVIDQGNVFLQAPNQAARIEIVRLIRMINRYVHGPEEADSLFPLLRKALQSLGSGQVTFPENYARGIELQILYRLGYIAPSPQWQEWVEAPAHRFDHSWDAALSAAVQAMVQTADNVSQL